MMWCTCVVALAQINFGLQNETITNGRNVYIVVVNMKDKLILCRLRTHEYKDYLLGK